MEGARHLRRLTLLLAASAAGCTYAGERLRDFGDLFRLEGRAGYGLQAHAAAGELVHAGAGSSRGWTGGWVYGRAEGQLLAEDHFPVSLILSLAAPERDQVHRLRLGPPEEGREHRCFLIFPGALNPGGLEKPEIHYLDLEAGFLAGVAGIDAGFSLGEFFDWFLGLFKFDGSWTFLDPAGDDPPPSRQEKRLWLPRRKREGVVLPR
jgi:hypothetical protein